MWRIPCLSLSDHRLPCISISGNTVVVFSSSEARMATFTTTCGYCHSWCCSLRLSHGVSATNFCLLFTTKHIHLKDAGETGVWMWAMSDIMKDSGWEYQWTVSCGTWPGEKTFFWIAQVSWMLHSYVHLYWRLYLSFLENVTSYGIDGPTINAAEAIGVLTNVSPVRHTEVFGWDVYTVSHRMWTGKNWIEVKCQGTSICSPAFSLLEIVNPIWFRQVAKNQGLKSEACLKQFCANLSHVIHSEGLGMGVSMNSFFA